MALQPGTMIGQNVRLERPLGQGGMGSVWVADHLTLHTKVAVKFISAEVAQNPDAVTRFEREASAAAQIKSPHVVQTFDHGVTGEGQPYIVMELLEGEDVGKRIQRLGALPVSEVVEIVTQTCKALGRAHAQGIVHRDIKPDNVFITESDGELFVKVLDFGIAKRISGDAMHMTSTGAMVGTPYYMSPEQVLSAKGVDLRSDLWSLGVVAYHALTGRLPFVAETLGALCVAIDRGVFAPVGSIRPELGGALDAWFSRVLARQPEARFASAKDMSDALKSAVSGFGLGTLSGTIGTPAVSLQTSSVPGSTLLEASVTAGSPPKSRAPLIVLAAAGAIGVLAVGGIALAVALGGGRAEVETAASVAPEAPALAASVPEAPEVRPPPSAPDPPKLPAAPPPPATVSVAPPKPVPVAAATAPKPVATSPSSPPKLAPKTSPQTVPAPASTKRDYGF